VVTDEAVTFGRGFFPFTYAAPPHDWLNSTGGAIGCGPPLATGAAVGAPGRRVIALQADTSRRSLPDVARPGIRRAPIGPPERPAGPARARRPHDSPLATPDARRSL